MGIKPKTEKRRQAHEKKRPFEDPRRGQPNQSNCTIMERLDCDTPAEDILIPNGLLSLICLLNGKAQCPVLRKISEKGIFNNHNHQSHQETLRL